MIVTTTFQRKTFVVQAKRITLDEIEEIAEWCGGVIGYDDSQIYIEKEIARNGRKARGYLDDWITNISGSDKFKIYRDKTFQEAFEEVLRDFPEEMMRKVVREEMREMLRSLMGTAEQLAILTSIGEMERTGLHAIYRVANMEAHVLPHAWNCEKRNMNKFSPKCSCGVGDDES